MYPNHRPRTGQPQRVEHDVGTTGGEALFHLLTGPQRLEHVDALLPEHRERWFPPKETRSMFLAQALSADGSCRAVVDEAMVQRVIVGRHPGSTETGGDCRARARLPLPPISTLARETGGIVTQGAAAWWHWRGRPVRLVDGTTVTLPDTEANQATDPQPSSQKAGLGFPMARIVGLLCLGSGALLDAAMGPCEGKGSDEQSRLREILDTLQSGEILLGDALYASDF